MGLARALALFAALVAVMGTASALSESEIRGPWVSPQLTESWDTIELYSTPVYRYYIQQGWYVPPGMTQSEAIAWASDDGIASPELDPPFGANVKISDDTGTGSQNEVSMDVDTNGNLHAGWNDNRAGNYACGYTTSNDEGKTWSANEMYYAGQTQAGDPVVVADKKGNLYRLCMGFSPAFVFDTSKSTDGGKTWSAWVSIAGWDKPWMAAYEGKLIVIGMSGGTINQVRSVDDGKTWDTPKTIGGQQGACIVNDAAGNLYASWGLGTVEFVKSTDWGDTWSPAKTLGPGSSIHGSPRSASLTMCDVSDDGQKVYVGWSRQAGSGDEYVVASSADGGTTWSQPVKINDGAASSRAILPTLAIDSSGKVHAAWVDNRNAVGDAYYTNSSDGGATWGANQRMSDSNPGKAWVTFIGDYTQLVVTPKGEVGYAFCENRDGSADIYYVSGKVASGGQTLASINVAPPTATVAADKTQQFAATGIDTKGSPMQIQPVWATTGGAVDQAGLYTPDKVGTFDVTATVGAISGKASVSVTPGALTTISVTPAAASITADETQQFTAKGADVKGNDVPLNPAWSASGGSVDGAGLYTPNRAGPYQVTATDQGKSGTGQVTVTPGTPVSLEVRPTTATVKADSKKDFAAVGVDAKGNEKNTTATWKVSGGTGAGSITGGGQYTPDKVGEYDIVAGALGLSAQAKVIVVPGKLDKFSIEPKNTSMFVGETLQYTFNGTDIKGNVITSLTVTWKVTTAPGSVSQDGAFKATKTGAGKVSATGTDGSVTKTAEAYVTVKEDPLAIIGGTGNLIPVVLLLILAIVGAAIAMALVKRKRRKAVQDGAYWQTGPPPPGLDAYSGAPPPQLQQPYPQPYADPYQQPYQQSPTAPQQWQSGPPPPGQQW